MNRDAFIKAKMIEKNNRENILKVNPKVNDGSGIYFLTREDEEGIRYGYVGQAKHLLTRLAQHLTGYQHIDLSLKKHGLYSHDNVFGWKVNFLNFPIEQLDAKEQEYVKKYANSGYQLRNKTGGGQGEGKRQIDEYRPAKGYRDGLAQGKKNASREVAELFDKYLIVTVRSDKPARYAERALEKFQKFLDYHNTGGNEVGE